MGPLLLRICFYYLALLSSKVSTCYADHNQPFCGTGLFVMKVIKETYVKQQHGGGYNDRHTPTCLLPASGTQQCARSLPLPLSLHGIALVTLDGAESGFVMHPVQHPQPHEAG